MQRFAETPFLQGVSVIIPTIQPRFLRLCLAGLARQTDRRFEVIVVENGLRDQDVPRAVNEFTPYLKLRHYFHPAAGGNRARNVGAAAARCGVLAFLDDDCVPAETWVDAILGEKDLIFGRVAGGGKVELAFRRQPPGWFRGVFRESLSEVDLGNRPRLLNCGEYVVSANMFVAATMFRRFGGFEESLGICGRDGPQLGNDEIEFTRRLAGSGVGTRYLAHARVEHIIPAERLDLGRIAARRYGQGMSDLALLRHEQPHLTRPEAVATLCREKSTESWLRAVTSQQRGIATQDARLFMRNNRVLRLAYLAGLGSARIDAQYGGGGEQALPESSGRGSSQPDFQALGAPQFWLTRCEKLDSVREVCRAAAGVLR